MTADQVAAEMTVWLRAQLDEDERMAREASPGPWRVDSETYAETIYGASDEAIVAGGRWGDEASVFESTADAVHIACHDPARVLAEVDAKRRILELHDASTDRQLHPDGWELMKRAVLALAQPYAGQDGWRDEWSG